MSRMNGIRQLIIDVLSSEERLRILFPKYENRPDGVFLKLLPGDEFIPNEFIEENRSVLDPVLELPLARKEVRAAVFEVLKKLTWGAKLIDLIEEFERGRSEHEEEPTLPVRRWLILSQEESTRLERVRFDADPKAALAELKTPGELHWAVLHFSGGPNDELLLPLAKRPEFDFGTMQILRFNLQPKSWELAHVVEERAKNGEFDSNRFQFIPFWDSDYYKNDLRFQPNQRIGGQYDAVYRPRNSESPKGTIPAMRLAIREALAIHPIPPQVIEDEKGMVVVPLQGIGNYPCESLDFRIDDEFLLANQDKVNDVLEAQLNPDGPEEFLVAVGELFEAIRTSSLPQDFVSLRDHIWERIDDLSKGYVLSPIEEVRLMRCRDKGDDVDCRLSAYRALKTKFELHEAADHFYFQDPVELFYPIIRNPKLDRGTALNIFWNKYLVDYIPEPGEMESDDEWVDLGKELYRNLLIGYYATEDFSFEINHQRDDRPDIPDSLKQPIHGQYPGFEA